MSFLATPYSQVKDQNRRIWLEKNGQTNFTRYLLYNSTINCSLIGSVMSSRLGKFNMRPFMFSLSNCNQDGTVWCAVNSRACSIADDLRLFSRTATSSPAFTS